ncbi:MAG TPA: hypothetical protein VGC86_15675 [Afipia sp.]
MERFSSTRFLSLSILVPVRAVLVGSGALGLALILASVQGVSAQNADTQDITPPPAVAPPSPPQPVPGLSVPSANANDKPIPPGGVRVTTRVPDPGKWDRVPSAPNTPRTFNCKALACPDASRVIITTLRSPTRNPDPQALEKYAKVDFPKLIRAQSAAQDVLSDGANKMDTLSSGVARLKDHPAIVNETKFTAGKKIIFINTAIIFAGPIMLRFSAMSPNRELARKSVGEFVAAAEISEGPPLPVTSGVQPVPVPLTPSKPEPSQTPKTQSPPNTPQSL